MARWPRLIIPGYPLHITQRGNNRASTFHSPNDFGRYSEMLALECARTDTVLHAYAFMTNHVHLLVTPRSTVAIASFMQNLGRRYVREFNTRYHRTGTLWEGRYKSSVVDTASYVIACMRYIDLNPVRAGLVTSPELYPWSSFGTLAFGAPDELVVPHAEYLALGASPAVREREYRALCGHPLDITIATEIRDAARSGSVVGTRGFRERTATELGRPVVRTGVGRKRSSRLSQAMRWHDDRSNAGWLPTQEAPRYQTIDSDPTSAA